MTSKERLKLIEARQTRLAKQVKGAQETLYKLLLEALDKIEQNPAYIEQVFAQFNKSEGVQLVTTLAQDMGSIATANYSYFLAFKDELDLSQKDFGAIKKTVDSFIQNRIGLSGSKVVKDSFLDSVLTDVTVKQKVKQQAYASLMSGEGATAFRKSLKSTVLGEQGKLGALEAHYNTFVYDTYNQVDSALQVQYADELELEAFVYEGGVISTTRPFCRKYNGRIVLKSEALKNWPNELTTGKPKSYSPLSDRGGYSCRHSLNFVSARRAMRMRDDLELDSNGKLRVKGAGNSNEFTPAKNEQEFNERVKNHVDGDVRLSGDLEFKNSILQSLEENKVGDVMPKLKGIKERSMKEGQAMVYNTGDKVIQINSKYNTTGSLKELVRDGKTFEDSIKERLLTETNPTARKQLNKFAKFDRLNVAQETTATKDIFTHELGHHLDYSILRKAENRNTIRKEFVSNYKTDAQSISSYASANDDEYIAESFLAYKNKMKIEQGLSMFFKGLGL